MVGILSWRFLSGFAEWEVRWVSMFEIFQLHICFLVVELPIVYLKTKNVVFVVKNNNVLFCSNIWRENHVMDRTLVSLNASELGCAVANYVTRSWVESPITAQKDYSFPQSWHFFEHYFQKFHTGSFYFLNHLYLEQVEEKGWRKMCMKWSVLEKLNAFSLFLK